MNDYNKIPGINASLLKACSFGAYSGWMYLNHPYTSDAMDFGTAVHCALLEPDHFDGRFAIEPQKFDRRTKAGKEGAAAFEAACAGRIVLSQDEAAKIERIIMNCRKIKPVRDALEQFEKEKLYTWTDGADAFKGKLDLVNERDGIIIDLKTTRDASPREFAKQSASLRYDIQLYTYRKALLSKGIDCAVYAIAVEPESGEVAMYNMDDFANNPATEEKWRRALAVAREVQTMTKCPAKYPAEVVNLKLPEWAKEME